MNVNYEALEEFDGHEDFIVVGVDDDDIGPIADDYVEKDYPYEIPVWLVMTSIMLIAILICGFIFYMSYKHEKFSGNSEDDNDQEAEGSAPTRLELGLSVKKWDESDALRFSVMGVTESMHTTATNTSICSASSFEDGSFGSGEEERNVDSIRTAVTASIRSESGSTRSDVRKSLVQLLAEPRCVLCSKAFVEGDEIASSTNPRCHHDFHKKCLTKHWVTSSTRSSTNSRNSVRCSNKGNTCPVCKETFTLEAAILEGEESEA